MNLNRVIGGLFILLSLMFVSPVFAGGGGVDTRVSSADDLHLNIVKVYFDPKLFTCKGMTVSFKFENPQDGDLISGSNGDNSSTIANEASNEFVNGKPYLRCSTYSKVYSSQLVWNRILDIDFKGANGEGKRQIAVSFGIKNNSETDMPLLAWETNSDPTPTPYPSANINAWILNQQVSENSNRKVSVKWGAFDGNPGTFTIYAKLTSNKNNWDKLLDGQRGPSATVIFKTDEEYHIKVSGCQDKVGTCADSNILLLSRLQKQNENIIVSQSPSLTLYPIAAGDNKQVEELNKKVENLEKELTVSQKKQSNLETKLNQIMDWVKSRFPFFK